MKTQLIVNRVNDWFYMEDLQLDECSLAMSLLIRLSTRTAAGFTYDRIKLANAILERSSAESIKAIDKAVVILLSRKLIIFEDKKKYGAKKILITDSGIKAVAEYKELMKNVD